MKKDILQKEADQLAIVVSPRPTQENSEDLWDTFLVNLRDKPITSILVNSRGYGMVNGEEVTTTVLRHFFVEIGPQQMVAIEPIQPSLFQLTNEFWVSFVYEDYMYDKKYVFAQGSIDESKTSPIPFSDREGVIVQ